MKKIIIIITAIVLLSQSSFAYIFSDINQTNYYFNSTQYLYVNNIIKGYSDGSFLTEQNINRAEILKILLEGNNIELMEITEDCFYDVYYEEWFSPYVCTAQEYGFVNGYEDQTFKPEQTVNKAEALKMIGQVYDWGIEEIEGEFWYLPYTTYAENKNLIPEVELLNENYSELTRGTVAEIIYRLLVVNELEIDVFNNEAEEEIQSNIEEQKSAINYQNIKIILSWGNSNTDFDAYLLTADNEEISYRRKISTDYQIIFEDNATEEIFNIENLENGNYELFISSNTGFDDLEATIGIYENDVLTQSFQSKSSNEELWKVFNILNSSEILLIDQYGACELIQKDNSYCN